MAKIKKSVSLKRAGATPVIKCWCGRVVKKESFLNLCIHPSVKNLCAVGYDHPAPVRKMYCLKHAKMLDRGEPVQCTLCERFFPGKGALRSHELSPIRCSRRTP